MVLGNCRVIEVFTRFMHPPDLIGDGLSTPLSQAWMSLLRKSLVPVSGNALRPPILGERHKGVSAISPHRQYSGDVPIQPDTLGISGGAGFLSNSYGVPQTAVIIGDGSHFCQPW